MTTQKRTSLHWRWSYLHHLLAIIVLTLWIWRLALLYIANRAEAQWQALPTGKLSQQSQSYSYGVYYKGHKIGFSQQQVMPTENGGSLFRDRAFWHFVTQGREQRLAMDSETRVDAHWHLQSLQARIDAGPAKISAKARVEKGALLVEILTGGQVHKQRMTIDAPILPPGMLRLYVAAQKPQVGAHFELKIFNPMLRSIDTVGILVEAQTPQGWRISEISQGSIKTKAEIDHQGFTTSEDSPLGFHLQREPSEQALQLDTGELPPDLILASAVPAHGKIPSKIRMIDNISLHITGVDASKYPALLAERQELNDAQLNVKVQAWPQAGEYRLPLDLQKLQHDRSAKEFNDIKQALKATPLVQSDDAQIIAQARQIIGTTEDPARAALKLTRWVFHNVTKISNVGVPSAIEVLQNRSGDCNEHTVLLTALGRAAGIPTRMAAGLVLADLQGQGPAFYYHAWVEFYLGETWHAVDPTFGQVPADASHLRFVLGSLQQQVALVGLMGQLHLTILSSSAKLKPVFDGQHQNDRNTDKQIQDVRSPEPVGDASITNPSDDEK